MAKKQEIKVIDWLKFNRLYFVISTTLLAAGLYALLAWGIPVSIDFTGGAVIEYKVNDTAKIDELVGKLKDQGIDVSQTQSAGGGQTFVKTGSLSSDQEQITLKVGQDMGIERTQIENVGPTVGPELVKKTGYAMAIAAIGILLWVATQFRKLTFGFAAIIATLHDTMMLLGMFCILGHFAGAEVDFLFVTAMLTTLSFSVHDTIVVFDRIREIRKKHGGELAHVANRALTETMRRSIINSVTIIIALLSLVILGGDTLRWFAVALLIGAISGTYSSPFVAVPLYVFFENRSKKLKK